MLTHVKFNLFDYQRKEVERLYKQKSRLVAWEMGTGKTYAGIALDIENRGRSIEHHRKEMGGDGKPRKTLIIAPKSVLDVWDKHCIELTNLDVYVIDTKNRAQFEKDVKDPRKGGYFIIHWEGIRLMPSLAKVQFFHIIADECHRAKNRKAQQTIALKKIPTLYKSALSGTPADNKPHDLWSVINWLWPRVYTSYWNFYKAYINAEMSFEGYSKIIGVKNIDKLRAQMAPWYSRLLKKDVLKDLPPKTYTEIVVELDPKQKKAYNQMQKTMVAWVEDHTEELERKDPIIASAVVAQLVRLQQFAVGYVQPELDEKGLQKFKWKWPKGTDKEHKLLHAKDPQQGGAKKVFLWKMTDPSSKIDTIIDILKDNPEKQFVIFSQFKMAIKLLGQRLDKEGIAHGLYTGDTSQADRARIVDEFQDEQLQVFAGTIAAGGVGITLTNASTVLFLDRSWSPAYNVQAEDRCHRIGQTDNVQIVDLMARGSVDYGRKELLDQKMGWLKEILGDKLADNVSGNLVKFTKKEGLFDGDDE